MATLGEIEQRTKEYASAWDRLGNALIALDDQIGAVKRKHMPEIRAKVRLAKAAKSRLAAALEESRDLFVRPKTMVLHGIKVGFTKEKGRIEWTDADAVVRLIERYFPDQVDVLVKTIKKPLKKAIEQLTAADLKKLGVTVHNTSDAIVIKHTDSDVARLVDALLGEQDETAPEDEALSAP